ncbi:MULTISPECIES: ABC transporter ATP-binding protein [Desulfococcus]|jgi:putative ABC transport system ATP-binding protein|uniref:ABC transporter related protein n=1 Tax=Desulfococcus multivorans DSM 2059 TaxID=1121405 RepID=S7V561_DESML|nr:ABC transporter ATP-binding protein [Desulfococcus multivorans]AOY57063.1 putative ABC transporter, ATP-binding protein [Desulfococcus multivorans]AQU99576.1 ABC transporter [Desulfococcus multivorans]EPR41774.1 ABC transporter related protein [Desulfococcus multivorans DSM 2059]MDX9818913.1 ABC transporter ATP-binding protein [Desulfococcus multivorans]SJZ88425.1 putative ABC transport system ATP-binding protein [Desulfococcus multivorans DSM 2059]
MKSSAAAAVIHAEKLTRTYTLGGARIIGIDAVDLDIPEGELVLLKGVSGSGKSTLLSLLAGLDRPTGGQLTVAGRDLIRASGPTLDDYRRRVVGMVFQSFNLMPTLNVLENVCLPALLAGRPDTAVQSRAVELLEWLGLGARLTHLPGQLSGGEMQRTAIARALINDPAVILADEPTGNLDTRNGAVVIELLAELSRSSKKTVVIATHGSQADKVATRRIRLRDGRIQ